MSSKKNRVSKLTVRLAAILLTLVFFVTAAFAFLTEAQIDALQMAAAQIVNDTNAPENAGEYLKGLVTDTYKSRQWDMDDANFDVVWKTFNTELTSGTAKDVKVYIVAVEAAIDLEHEDLAGSLVVLSADAVSGDVVGYAYKHDNPNQFTPIRVNNWKSVSNAYIENYASVFHGSHVAGIMAARHNNMGIAGADKNVKVIPVFTQYSYLEANTFDWIADTLYPKIQAISGETNPKVIVQLAYGTSDIKLSDDNTKARLTATKKLSDKGIIVVTAAGNELKNLYAGTWQSTAGSPDSPYTATRLPYCAGISGDNVISVAAHNVERNLLVDANYGGSNYSTSGANSIVDLSAPGAKIVSLGRNGEYWVASGASMASPHVSGAAALLWRLFPTATAAQIKTLILQGANATNGATVLPHNGETGTTIGSYVRTGFLDVAKSVKVSKTVLGTSVGRDITIPLKSVTIASNADSITPTTSTVISVTSMKPATADNKTITMHADPASAAAITASGDKYVFTPSSATTPVDIPVRVWAKDSGSKDISNELTITIRANVFPITGAAIAQGNTQLASNAVVPMTNGNITTLTGLVLPAEATYTDSDISWEITENSSSAIQAVRSGRNYDITAANAGSATVKFTAGQFSATCTITVTASVDPIDPITPTPDPTPATEAGGGGCNAGMGSIFLLIAGLPLILKKRK